MSEEYRAAARQRLARVLAAPADHDHDRRPGPGRSDPGRPGPGRSDPGRPGQAEPADQAGRAAPGGVVARLAGGAFDPGRSGLRALVVVAVVVVLGAAALAWWSRPRPEPVVPLVTATGQPGGAGGSGAVAGAPGPTEPAELVVAVSGEVREPGLVRLPPGARVADAIEAAGGLLPGADVDHLNLARKVTDGELITVGIPPPPGEPAPGGAVDPGTGNGTGTKVNLNTATLAELETLPGIGPALGQRIIDHRTAHGAFTSVGELREVSGIGEVRFAELQDLVTV